MPANRLTWVGVSVEAWLDVGMQMQHEVAENLIVDFVGGIGPLECLTCLQQVGKKKRRAPRASDQCQSRRTASDTPRRSDLHI